MPSEKHVCTERVAETDHTASRLIRTDRGSGCAFTTMVNGRFPRYTSCLLAFPPTVEEEDVGPYPLLLWEKETTSLFHPQKPMENHGWVLFIDFVISRSNCFMGFPFAPGCADRGVRPKFIVRCPHRPLFHRGRIGSPRGRVSARLKGPRRV